VVEDDDLPGASVVRSSPRKKKKRKKAPAKHPELPYKWLAIGGGALTALLILGGVILWITRGKPGTLGGWSNGSYAVVDSLPEPPPAAASDLPSLPEPPGLKSTVRVPWAAKADPPAKVEDLTNAKGAATPEQSVLFAAIGGPYIIGVPIVEPSKRIKHVKTKDPDKPWKTESLAEAPFPVVDIRSGEEVGAFPVYCRVNRSCRLSSDAQHLATWEVTFDFQGKEANKVNVWKRDAEDPILRQAIPGPVFWSEFIGPDRLALAFQGATPGFMVINVTKAGQAISTPLPSAEFPPTVDFADANAFPPFTNGYWPTGAVSPGGNYVALAGKGAVLVFSTADGSLVGRCAMNSEVGIKDTWAVAFSEGGDEVLAGYSFKSVMRSDLRVWSMNNGQILHTVQLSGNKPLGSMVITGPEPGTLIFGGSIVDVASGKPIADLPEVVQRWAGPNHFLTQYSNQAPNLKELEDAAGYQVMGGSFVVPFKREEYQKKITAFVEARAKAPPTRPSASQTDRMNVAIVKPQTNVQWTVKPSPSSPLPADFMLAAWPDAFALTEAATLPTPRSWVRHNLKTGKPVGLPIPLWPDSVTDVAGGPGRLVALTIDGQRLVLVDPADTARVDIWDVTGKRLLSLRPYNDEPMAWLAWSAGGTLLTAASDRITGWDVAGAKAVFEIEGVYTNWTLAPGGAWLAAATPGGNVDFFDGATGKHLGRLPTGAAFAISPDCTRLVREGIQVWDLETGKRTTIPEVPMGLAGGPWVGPRCLLRYHAISGNTPGQYLLYDLDVHTHTVSFADVPPIEIKNDVFGRSWMGRTAAAAVPRPDTGWIPARIPGMDGLKRELAFGPGSTIRVEVDVGIEASNQAFAKQAAEQLQRRGLKIGRDGWILRADHKVGSGNQKFMDPLTEKETVSVTALTITWKLISPEGTEVWQDQEGRAFNPFSSKYVVVGSRRGQFSMTGGGFQRVDLDFQGKDPVTAQVEEILEQMRPHRQGLPAGMPACVVKGENGLQALPIRMVLEGGK
jgi:hypothetical protein